MNKSLRNKVIFVLLFMVSVFYIWTLICGNNTVQSSVNAAEQEFYMNTGAEVRIGDKSGIRFSATVSKGFLERVIEESGAGGNIKFYSVVNREGGDVSTERTVEIPMPVITETQENYLLKTSVVFDNLNEEELVEAVGVDLVVQTKVDVINTNGDTNTYVASGEAGARSMRAVANAALLEWNEQSGYDKSAVEKYLGTVTRSETVDGIIYADGTVDINIPYEFNSDKIGVYIGTDANEYIATKNPSIDNRWLINDFNSEILGEYGQVKISVFIGNNDVYTFNLSYDEVNYISQENITDLQTASSGKYVLTEDIDMTGITWSPSVIFTGIFDGNGYAIKNFTTEAGTFKGLFYRLKDATVKNLIMTDVVLAGTNAPITSYIEGGNVNIENVFIDVKTDTGTRTSGLVGYQTIGTLTVKDVFIKYPVPLSNAVMKGFITAYIGSEQIIDGVYCVGKNMTLHSVSDGEGAAPIYKNPQGENIIEGKEYFIFDDIVSMYVSDAYKSIPDFIKKNIEINYADEISKIIDINQENIGELELATDGYYRLTEDIDMSGIVWGANRAGKDYNQYYFKGTLDGNGFTISNFTTGSASHTGGLFWSLEGATVKNLTFKNAKLLSTNGLLGGRTKRGSLVKIENVAVEISEMAMNSAGLVCASDANMLYENVMIYVKQNSNSEILKSGFLCGLYQQNAVVKDVYCVSDTLLELTPTGHAGIITDVNNEGGADAVEGTDYFMFGVEDFKAFDTQNLPTELLRQAKTEFFI